MLYFMFQEILTFAKYILRKFFSVVKDSPTAFMELLFWKNNRESIELVDGYGTHNPK